MAKIRRVGFGTVFHLENEKVGIGTTGKFFTEVRVLKNLELSDANAVTQAQLENYQGFLSNETRLSDNNPDLNKLVGYVRGEAYYGESHAHTQDDGTVVNMVGSAHTTFSHNVIDDSSNIQSGAMGDIIIDGNFTVSSGTTYCSSVDQLTCVANFTVPTGDTDDRIHCHTAGSMRFNEDLGTLEFYTGDEWRTINSFKDTGNRGRGLFAAGYRGDTEVETDIITYVEVSTLGNAVDFGRMNANGIGSRRGGCSNGTRGLAGGASPNADHIDYLTIASEGDSIDFGNLTVGRYYVSSCSSSTRGVWMGGLTHPSPGSDRDTIDYVEIATTGNALDFGNLTAAENNVTAAASPTRGFCFGLAPTGAVAGIGINMITFSSTGNAVDFGDGSFGFNRCAAGSNNVRALIAGRQGPSSAYRGEMIQKFNMASGGNAVNFGELTRSRAPGNSAVTNATRAVWGGGFTDPSAANMSTVIDYVQFETSGNATFFGDMGLKRDFYTAINDTHGGLGGF